MTNPRYRPVLIALAALAGVWLLVWAGIVIAGSFKMTAEKFGVFAGSLDLNRLHGEPRAKALKELAEKLNRLPPEERRKVRLGRRPDRLFDQMTEEEKGAFIDATMPTGFKQMISSFEQLSPEKRKRAVDGAIKRMRNQQEAAALAGDDMGTNKPPPLSEDLQKRIVSAGISTFYKESSAQTKAEVAPLLEELQRTLESGRLFRDRQ